MDRAYKDFYSPALKFVRPLRGSHSDHLVDAFNNNSTHNSDHTSTESNKNGTFDKSFVCVCKTINRLVTFRFLRRRFSVAKPAATLTSYTSAKCLQRKG